MGRHKYKEELGMKHLIFFDGKSNRALAIGRKGITNIELYDIHANRAIIYYEDGRIDTIVSTYLEMKSLPDDTQVDLSLGR